MGYCTPNNPEDEPMYSLVTCHECDGEGWIENEDGDMEKCYHCDGDGEVIFENE